MFGSFFRSTKTAQSDSRPAVWGTAGSSLRAMWTVFLVGMVLMAFKFYAYWKTGSSAILSDALESIINVVAGALAVGSLLFSAKPPDETHPYGHGKIEYFSAGFEGALIALAALGIFRAGLLQILDPQPLPHLQVGLVVLAGTAVVNLLLGAWLVRLGSKTQSLVLVADGKHLLTDVYSSAAVFVGLTLVLFTGRLWLDGAVACVAGVYIVLEGFRLVHKSFWGLMDTSDPELLEDICALLVKNRRDVWIDVHKLRAWRSGARVHVDFHLILPGDLPLEAGHREVKELEQIFEAHYKGQADLLVHLDPCTDKECPVCSHDPCDLRQEKTLFQRTWQVDTVTADPPLRGSDRKPRVEGDA